MTDQFQNLSVDLDSLPKIEEVDFKPLHKKYLTVTLLNTAIFFFLLGAGATAVIYFNEELVETAYLIAGSIWFGVLMIRIVLLVLGFKKKKYALREKDIIYSKGLIWSIRTAIPFNRIQHAEIKQGPIERKFKLSSLKVFTAGGQSSDLVIPGLPSEQAQTLKDFVLGKTADDGDQATT